MKNKILVVAAHPDDEILGMGGTLTKMADEGSEISILFLSAGEASRGKKFANEVLRQNQAKQVRKLLKVNSLTFKNFPDNAFDSVALLKITQEVEMVVRKLSPEVVFTHHHGDLNIDHRLTFQAVMTALRPGKSSVRKIYSFEVLSSTEWQVKTTDNVFLPSTYVDIEKHVDKKIELMKIYSREVTSFPFPRSEEGIMTLAKFRGMESGLKFAEAFQLVRATEI